MKHANLKNELNTISTVLLSNLDEAVFFAKLTGFIQEHIDGEKVQASLVHADGGTQIVAENGKAINKGESLAKGQGLAGYVSRLKRAYYSNNVKRDPIAAGSNRAADIEAELVVPLIHENTVLATIHILSSQVGKQFNESDIQAVQEIINELKAPVRNMGLLILAKRLNNELLAKIEAREKEMNTKNSGLSNVVENQLATVTMVGMSKAFMDIAAATKKVAAQDLPVLMEGAHGVGKKSFARKIHEWSSRKGNCQIVTCSSLNEAQLERELFNKNGSLVLAQNGTIIIDEICSISTHIQNKILNFLITGEILTYDTHEKVRLNVRVIATSKNSLQSLVESGKFREDLFYRLNTVNIKVPSLRERREDIRALSEFFLNQGKNKDQAKVLTSGALEKLMSYGWPGNAHELKNVMERTYILTDGQYIEENHLPELAIEQVVEKVEAPTRFTEMALHDLEKKHILDTLDHLNGNKTRAAKSLGITVKTLYNKLHSYGMIEARELQ